jgi:tRNA1Val (adenine37-N6)-methyltransferase
MKVSTDACIQGAWTPINDDVKKILDIGTGTGLLSLMLAQRNAGVEIDAIEQDGNAAEQAEANFRLSPWSDRLLCFQGDAREYQFQKKFDLIVCNPPFFTRSLLGNDDQRNQARHGLSLTQDDLINIIDDNLSGEGYGSILLPVKEHEAWEKVLAKNEYVINKQLNIIPSHGKLTNRVVSICSRKKGEKEMQEVVIREAQQEYTHIFRDMMKGFYLNL